MFKFIPIFVCLALAHAATTVLEPSKLGGRSQKKDEVAEIIPIIKSTNDHNPDGSYNFMYEGGDGSFREEKAILVEGNGEEVEKHFAITGMYKYIDAEGKEIVVRYIADENGFVPIGTNIPESISNAAQAAHDNVVKEEPEAQQKTRVNPTEKKL